MKFAIIAAAALAATSGAALAGGHFQVNENAADAAGNKGTVMGAYLRDTPIDGLAPNAASGLKGGWGNVGSVAAGLPTGQVSNENGSQEQPKPGNR